MATMAKELRQSLLSMKIWLVKKNSKETPTPLNTANEEIVLQDKYCKLYLSVSEVEKKLQKLISAKEDILKERFDILQEEYRSYLDKTKPLLADYYEQIDDRLRMLKTEQVTLANELSIIQKQIQHENTLNEIGVFSNEEYLEKFNPLKAREEEFQIKDKIKQIQILTLEKAIKNKCPEKLIAPGSSDGRSTPFNPNQPLKFYKDPAISSVLSFVFFGLGQIYNGEIGKGILFIVLAWISITLSSFYVGLVTTPTLWIWGIVDANRSAKKINKSQQQENA